MGEADQTRLQAELHHLLFALVLQTLELGDILQVHGEPLPTRIDMDIKPALQGGMASFKMHLVLCLHRFAIVVFKKRSTQFGNHLPETLAWQRFGISPQNLSHFFVHIDVAPLRIEVHKRV